LLLSAVILGLIQGLTEFIPVSSSGHLLFVEKLLGWDSSKLTFDVALHLGTIAALLAFFWRDWVGILRSFAGHLVRRVPYAEESESGVSGRLLVPIIVASVPVALVGARYGDVIEAMRTRPWMLPAVAALLVVVALVMLLAEVVGKRRREMAAMGYVDYLAIGFAQVLALFPGVSRSGITISAGLFRNLDRAAAARFSFLLSTPAVLGAGLMAMKDVYENGLPSGEWAAFAVGFLTAAVSGYVAIRFLMNYLQRGSLAVFAIYRFILAAGILLYALRF